MKMKARYVSESIKFERGGDPHKGLGIGIWDQIKKNYESDQGWKDYSNDEALVWAARRDKKQYVEFLLAKGVDPNYNNGAALLRAADNNNIEILRILLDHGMSQSSLNAALEERGLKLETMKLLVDAGAEIVDETAMLDSLIWHGSPETAKFIFSKGVRIKDHHEIQRSFSFHPNLEMLKVFLNNGLKLNKNSNDILLRPAGRGDAETLKFLLDLGFNAAGESGGEVLINAATSGNSECVKLLIDAGADLNTIDENIDYYVERYSALTMAAKHGHTEIVKILLDAGADINILNDKAHKIARKNGHTETLELIKEYKKMFRQRAK
jgi:cytohesin